MVPGDVEHAAETVGEFRLIQNENLDVVRTEIQKRQFGSVTIKAAFIEHFFWDPAVFCKSAADQQFLAFDGGDAKREIVFDGDHAFFMRFVPFAPHPAVPVRRLGVVQANIAADIARRLVNVVQKFAEAVAALHLDDERMLPPHAVSRQKLDAAIGQSGLDRLDRLYRAFRLAVFDGGHAGRLDADAVRQILGGPIQKSPCGADLGG